MTQKLENQPMSNAIQHIPSSVQDNNDNVPPAVTLPLTGRHLIEASAGTGKTWTLTGLVLRLLVEAGQPCDKIIATTFTKSAAAEMRGRIRERLQDFSRLLRIITQTTSIQKQHQQILEQSMEVADTQAKFWQLIVDTVTQIGDSKLQEIIKDPINKHLVLFIQQQGYLVNSQPASASKKATTHNDLSTTNDNADKESQATTQSSHRPNKSTLNFPIALQRTNTALNQLDRLFISTLDSLCQKWLREFSSETGYSADVQISNDVKPIALSMIHDQLRAFWMHIHQQQPKIYALMQVNGLSKASDYMDAVEKALDFYTAPIDSGTIDSIDLASIEALIERIANYQMQADFAVYFDDEYRLSLGFSKENLHNKFQFLTTIISDLQKHGLQGLLNFSKEQNDVLGAIKKVFDDKKGFKKGYESQAEQFKSLPIVQAFYQLSLSVEQLNNHIKQLDNFFTQFITRYVREQLPKFLEAQRLTTFSLQLARLNQALQGRQGEALARYIRHQYPIALIDESQDINTEQALLIQRIYLDTLIERIAKTSDSKQPDNLFLLLVGDPKQAIYGFRGGDVHNYTTLKKQFEHKPIPLLVNRRSSKALIDSLNQWYGVATMTDEQFDAIEADLNPSHPYFMGEEIYYRKIDADRDSAELVALTLTDDVTSHIDTLPALYYLNVPYQLPLTPATDKDSHKHTHKDDKEQYADYTDAIAAQILAWFDNSTENHQTLIYDGRRLSLNDICVLARSNPMLNEVEKTLEQHGIATIRSGNHSVFSGVMSADLQILMAALLNPFHQAKVKTLLMTKFFGLSLRQANQLLEQTEQSQTPSAANSNAVANPTDQTLAAQINDILIQAGTLWQKEGFLVAIQHFLTQSLRLPNQPKQTFWQRLASDHEGERLLIDLRQLLDILSETFQGQGGGEYQLYDWYCQQCQLQPTEDGFVQHRLPSENGVKLMTIHRSKGLEFPIVFVVGLDKNSVSPKEPKFPLYLYGQSNQQNPLLSRRLSALPEDSDMDYKGEQNTNERYESLRLKYVALTRAREQVYIVTQATKPVKEVKNDSKSSLRNFIKDDKSFKLNDNSAQAVTQVDINSLSKYFNPSLTLANIQLNKKNAQPTFLIDYENSKKTIPITKFEGWSNTSFTALSRFVSHERQAIAVQEADYDGIAELNISDVDANTNTNTNVKDSDNDINSNSNSHRLSDSAFEERQMANLDIAQERATGAIQELDASPPAWHTETFDITGLELSEAFGHHVEPMDDFSQIYDDNQAQFYPDTQMNGFDDNYPMTDNYIDDYQLADDFYNNFDPTYLMQLPPSVVADETKLLRFNFEKGASAGTFLHKVLEDLANNQFDDTTSQFDSNQAWLPPKRWSVMIDRALRRQQLPLQYYSSALSAAGEIVKLAELDEQTYRNMLQPAYFELTEWLHEVIHTPFATTGQRPIDIRQQQKSAEMGFNMRLQGEWSVSDLNELFEEQGKPLNLNTSHANTSVWQYLRGEIDLVYQHDDKFYIVDYKSNYLGNTFDDYQPDALDRAMDEHRYWLQASIYQVALHRFLQLRLPNYDMDKHLGAVEYAFIRGMSPQHGTGKMVWQPDNNFILELDNLFGRK